MPHVHPRRQQRRLHRVAFAALVATVTVLAPLSAGARAAAPHDRVDAKVTRSTDAPAGALPGVVALVVPGKTPRAGHFCGGTLISPLHVLTAAHCVLFTDERGQPVKAPIDIYAGDTDLDPPDAGVRRTVRAADQFVHPEYDPNGAAATSDIAVLRLPQPITPVQPVLLSVPGLEILNVAEAPAEVYGWGGLQIQSTPEQPNNSPSRLQVGQLPMAPDRNCTEVIPDFDAASEVCAGKGSATNPDVDACFGDSGGPLVADVGGGIRIQVGLVSRGPTCGETATAYTAVAAYRDFIEFLTGLNLASFPDINGDVHEANIERIGFYGIASGRSDGTYGPAVDVSRGAMAKFIAVTLDLPLPAGPTQFPDVPESNPFAPFIQAVVNEGIASGFTDGTYRPNANVTRGQMAKFLALAAGLTEVPGSRFPDTRGNIFEGFINAIVDAGITTGFTDGTYRPSASVSRAQMATFLVRAFIPEPPVEPPVN